MCELIVKLVCGEMNIRRCIKKSIAVHIRNILNLGFGLLKQFGTTCRMPNFFPKSLHPTVHCAVCTHRQSGLFTSVQSHKYWRILRGVFLNNIKWGLSVTIASAFRYIQKNSYSNRKKLAGINVNRSL